MPIPIRIQKIDVMMKIILWLKLCILNITFIQLLMVGLLFFLFLFFLLVLLMLLKQKFFFLTYLFPFNIYSCMIYRYLRVFHKIDENKKSNKRVQKRTLCYVYYFVLCTERAIHWSGMTKIRVAIIINARIRVCVNFDNRFQC